MACACGNDTCSCKAPEMIQLRDEHGVLHSFYVADRLDIKGRPYAFAVSVEEEEQYALLKVETVADGSTVYRNIDTEAEWADIREFMTQIQ